MEAKEVPKLAIDEYLLERAYNRQVQLYHGVLFMMFVLTAPPMLFMFLLLIGLFLGWSMTTIALVCGGSLTGFVVTIALYYSIHSKRYVGLVCHSSLYVTPNDVYQIEWLPVKVTSQPVEVGGKTYFINEVINHPDSDLPYMIVITEGKFDTAGGEMVKTHKDFKFYRGVKAVTALCYDTLVELRCIDIGIQPIELEEKVPVPVVFMTDSWYHHSRIFQKFGRLGIPDNPELLAKAVKVFDDLHAREWREKAELYEKRIGELEGIQKDYLHTAKQLFQRYVSQKKLFGYPAFTKVSRWSQLSTTKKLGFLLLIIGLVSVAVLLLVGIISI